MDPLDAQLARIREKLETVRTWSDPCFNLFGSQKHRYQLGAPLAAEELRPLEAIVPADFRRFLLEVGNGGAGPVYGWEPLRPERYRAGRFRPGDEEQPGTVFLYEHGCGMYDFLVLEGEGAGQMWFSDDHSDVHPYGQSFIDHYEAWLDKCVSRRPR